MNQALEQVVSQELAKLGYDLVEFRRRGTGARPLLDVRIDRVDGATVTVDDCAAASRAIEARFDAENLLGDRYVLEVSSPGVERPLRNAADWRRFTGRRARVNSPSLGGSVEGEIVDVEGAPGIELGVVRLDGGEERRIPLVEVKEARLVFHWKR